MSSNLIEQIHFYFGKSYQIDTDPQITIHVNNNVDDVVEQCRRTLMPDATVDKLNKNTRVLTVNRGGFNMQCTRNGKDAGIQSVPAACICVHVTQKDLPSPLSYSTPNKQGQTVLRWKKGHVPLHTADWFADDELVNVRKRKIADTKSQKGLS